MLPIGQLPDAANAKALVRNYSAAAPRLAVSSRCCSAAAALPLCGGAICIFATAPRQFCHGASASNKPHSARPASLFATAPWLVSPPRRPGQQHFPDGALPRRRLSQGVPPRRPGQQHFPDGALPRRRLSQGALPRRPGQQQTSFGGEKYSGLASNLVHPGWIWLLLGRGRSSSKSPRARILVLGTSGAH